MHYCIGLRYTEGVDIPILLHHSFNHLSDDMYMEMGETMELYVSFIEIVSAFCPASNPGRSNEHPIWWR